MAQPVRRLHQLEPPARPTGHSPQLDPHRWSRAWPQPAPNPAPPGPFTLADCADAAADVLAALDIREPVDWLGSAWGGHVGVFFAGAYPHACRTLITIASPIHALPRPRRRAVRLAYVLHKTLGPRAVAPLLAEALLGKEFQRNDPLASTIVRESFIRANRRGMQEAIRSISLHRPDATDHLADVKVPTLMITGADDAMCTPADTAAWAARIPTGRSLAVPGAGHLAPLFEPRTADIITDFWS